MQNICNVCRISSSGDADFERFEDLITTSSGSGRAKRANRRCIRFNNPVFDWRQCRNMCAKYARYGANFEHNGYTNRCECCVRT